MEQLPENQDEIVQSILAKNKKSNLKYTLAASQQSKYQTACEAQMANVKEELSTNISFNPDLDFYDYLTAEEEQEEENENVIPNENPTSY